MVTVDAFGYQIWQQGRMAPNLLEASAMFAPAGDPNPRDNLPRTLQVLHRLLAHNADEEYEEGRNLIERRAPLP